MLCYATDHFAQNAFLSLEIFFLLSKATTLSVHIHFFHGHNESQYVGYKKAKNKIYDKSHVERLKCVNFTRNTTLTY